MISNCLELPHDTSLLLGLEDSQHGYCCLTPPHIHPSQRISAGVTYEQASYTPHILYNLGGAANFFRIV